ncbi:unnamed protein product [Amoebophrya sp. A25]|nr:unnamed protein product [Amoebophrya sp. A25]|eukprot:GSA25T00023424001.1
MGGPVAEAKAAGPKSVIKKSSMKKQPNDGKKTTSSSSSSSSSAAPVVSSFAIGTTSTTSSVGHHLALEVSAVTQPPPPKPKRGARKRKLTRQDSEWYESEEAAKQAAESVTSYNRNSWKLSQKILDAKCFPGGRTAGEFMAQTFMKDGRDRKPSRKDSKGGKCLKFQPEEWKIVKSHLDEAFRHTVQGVANQVRESLAQIFAVSKTIDAKAEALKPWMHSHATALRVEWRKSSGISDALASTEDELGGLGGAKEDHRAASSSSVSQQGLPGTSKGENAAEAGASVATTELAEGLSSSSTSAADVSSEQLAPGTDSASANAGAKTLDDGVGGSTAMDVDEPDTTGPPGQAKQQTSSSSNGNHFEKGGEDGNCSDDSCLGFKPASTATTGGAQPSCEDSDDDFLNYVPPTATFANEQALRRAIDGENSEAVFDDFAPPLTLEEVGDHTSGVIAVVSKGDKNLHSIDLLKAAKQVVAAGLDAFPTGPRRVPYEKVKSMGATMLKNRYKTLGIGGPKFCSKFHDSILTFAPNLARVHEIISAGTTDEVLRVPDDDADECVALIAHAEVPCYDGVRKGLEAKRKFIEMPRRVTQVLCSDAGLLLLGGDEDPFETKGRTAQQSAELDALVVEAEHLGVVDDRYEAVAMRLSVVASFELDFFECKVVKMRMPSSCAGSVSLHGKFCQAREDVCRNIEKELSTPCTLYELSVVLAKVIPGELRWELRRVVRSVEAQDQALREKLLVAAETGEDVLAFPDWITGGPHGKCMRTMSELESITWATRVERYTAGKQSEDSLLRPFYVWCEKRMVRNGLNANKISAYVAKLVELKPHMENDPRTREHVGKVLEKLKRVQMHMTSEQHTACRTMSRALADAEHGLAELNKRQQEKLAGLRGFVGGS